MKISQPVIAAGRGVTGLSNGDYGTSVGCTFQKKAAGSWDIELNEDVPDGSLVVVASLAGTAGGSDPVLFTRVGYRPAGTQGTGASVYTYLTNGTLTDAAVSFVCTTMPAQT